MSTMDWTGKKKSNKLW